jgi:hypothetical protein
VRLDVAPGALSTAGPGAHSTGYTGDRQRQLLQQKKPVGKMTQYLLANEPPSLQYNSTHFDHARDERCDQAVCSVRLGSYPCHLLCSALLGAANGANGAGVESSR